MKGLSLWLFVLLGCLNMLLTTGHIDTPDGVVMFNVTRALARGSLSFPSLERYIALAGPSAPAGADGEARQYGKYGLGLSLAALPSYVVSRALLPLTPASEREVFLTPPVREGLTNRGATGAVEWNDGRSFRGLTYDTTPARFEQAWSACWVGCTNAWIVAGIAALALLLLVELGFGVRAAGATALVIGVASPLFHYATAFFAEPLTALLALGALLQVVRFSRDGERRRLALVGLLVGAIGLTKVALLLLAMPVLAALLVSGGRRSTPEALRRLALVALGAVVPLGVAAAYNLVRFGTPFETGYGEEANAWRTPMLEGLSGLLLSPGRGAVLYCPALLGGWLLLRRFQRRSLAVALVAGLSLPLLALLYAKWWLWEGVWCWGPRFLLPGVALALLPLAEHFEGGGRPLARRTIDALLLASLVISLSSLLVNYADFYTWLKRYAESHPEVVAAHHRADYYGLLRWDWDVSPLLRYWSFPRRNYLLVAHAITHPGATLAIFVLAGAGFGIALARFSRLVRAESSAPRGVNVFGR
ncbi:MAG: hypothetical protein U0527_13860 [Candidatus Eisenbacteria bacterium]